MELDEKIEKIEIAKIIKVQLIKGTGKKENPVRQVYQYWDLDGKLIYVEDSFSTNEDVSSETRSHISEKSSEDLEKEFVKYANRHNECHLGLNEKTESCQSCLKNEQCNAKHTIKFSINNNLKEILKILNTINEDEQEFTIEKFLQMKEILTRIKRLEPFTKYFVSLYIDGQSI